MSGRLHPELDWVKPAAQLNRVASTPRVPTFLVNQRGGPRPHLKSFDL